MPLKNGHLTAKERAFADRMARTGDAPYSAEKAGYGTPAVTGYQVAARPEVRAEVARKIEDLMFKELLPLAYAAHAQLLRETTPAGARLGAVKLAYDRTIGNQDDDSAEKEPSEMSYEELQASIARLKREQEAREEGAVDITPQASIFD